MEGHNYCRDADSDAGACCPQGNLSLSEQCHRSLDSSQLFYFSRGVDGKSWMPDWLTAKQSGSTELIFDPLSKVARLEPMQPISEDNFATELENELPTRLIGPGKTLCSD